MPVAVSYTPAKKTAASIPTASIQRIREPQRMPTSNPGREKQVTGPPAAT